MAEVYYYLPGDQIGNVVECGLKLSQWFGRELILQGESRRYITALLNPRDDMEKYRSHTYACIKINISPKNCLIGDRHLFEVGICNPQAMELYTGSIIPLDRYVFGAYRHPECLIGTTILPDQIVPLGKNLDSPILFDNSQELYMANVLEVYKEEQKELFDAMLYSLYSRLADEGKADRMEDTDGTRAVFFDHKREKIVCVHVPDLTQY